MMAYKNIEQELQNAQEYWISFFNSLTNLWIFVGVAILVLYIGFSLLLKLWQSEPSDICISMSCFFTIGWVLFFLLLQIIFATILPNLIQDLNLASIIATTVASLVWCTALAWELIYTQHPFLDAISIPSLSKILKTLISYITFFPCYWLIYIAILLLFSLFSWQITGQKVAQHLLNSEGMSLYLGVFCVIILAPISEEVLFRGLLYGSTKPFLGNFLGMVVTSILFALMHGDMFALAPIFALGMFLNWIYEHSHSLWIPIIAHAFHNSITIIYLFFFF